MDGPDRPPPLHLVVEAARLSAVRTYLNTSPDLGGAPFDGMVRQAAVLMQTPVAMLTLIGQDHQRVLAATGTGVRAIPRSMALCDLTIAEPAGALLVPDACRDSRFHLHPMVASAPHIRFYAGVCLVDPDGYAIGTLCTLGVQPATTLAEAFGQLAELGQRAMNALAAHRQQRAQLAQAARGAILQQEAAPPCWLGVRTQHTAVGAKGREGRLVASVAPASPAARAGLRIGDMILAIDDRPARRRTDLSAAVQRCNPGDVLTLQILRDGMVFDRVVTVERAPDAMPTHRRAG